MNFLPSFRPAVLVAVGVALSACHSVTDTPANRRELYNNTYNQSGSWHDYTRRREAEAMTGVSGGSAPSALPNRAPSSGVPVTPGAPGALPPGAAEPAPMQAPLTPAAGGGAPAVPPPAEVAPTIPGADAGAVPSAGGTTDTAATPAPQ